MLAADPTSSGFLQTDSLLSQATPGLQTTQVQFNLLASLNILQGEVEMVPTGEGGQEGLPLPGSDANDPVCNSKEYTVFRVMEFGIKVIPSILFFILGSMRYFKIRDIG